MRDGIFQVEGQNAEQAATAQGDNGPAKSARALPTISLLKMALGISGTITGDLKADEAKLILVEQLMHKALAIAESLTPAAAAPVAHQPA